MGNWAEEQAPCLVVVLHRGWNTMLGRQEPDEEVQEQIASVLSDPAASIGFSENARLRFWSRRVFDLWPPLTLRRETAKSLGHTSRQVTRSQVCVCPRHLSEQSRGPRMCQSPHGFQDSRSARAFKQRRGYSSWVN